MIDVSHIVLGRILRSTLIEEAPHLVLDGQAVRLRPVTAEGSRLWFIFRDGTSGHETYATARFLYADLGDDEWRYMICVEAGNILSAAIALGSGHRGAHPSRT